MFDIRVGHSDFSKVTQTQGDIVSIHIS